MAQLPIPTQIEPASPTEIRLAWNDGAAWAVPYVELRFYCPCANCVDENTGQRVIEHSSISPEIRATGVQLIGRYAIQIAWSDQHSTGMYHFDRLRELCEKTGRKLNP